MKEIKMMRKGNYNRQMEFKNLVLRAIDILIQK